VGSTTGCDVIREVIKETLDRTGVSLALSLRPSVAFFVDVSESKESKCLLL